MSNFTVLSEMILLSAFPLRCFITRNITNLLTTLSQVKINTYSLAKFSLSQRAVEKLSAQPMALGHNIYIYIYIYIYTWRFHIFILLFDIVGISFFRFYKNLKKNKQTQPNDPPLNDCPGYDTKPSVLVLWGKQRTPSVPLLSRSILTRSGSS